MSDDRKSPTTAAQGEQLQSLRIDPERKLPRRSKGAVVFWIVTGVLIGFALSLGMSGGAPKEAAAGKDGAPAATPKPDANVAPKSDVLLTATGYVTPRRRIALSPQVIGIVAWVGIEKGDAVEKDQVLVRLDDKEYVAAVQEAEANEAVAAARLAELENGTRKEDIANQRARVAELEAQLKWAESTLARQRVLVEQTNVESRQKLDDMIVERDASAARLDAAKATLEQLVTGARREQIDAARASLDSAKARLVQARERLEDTVIRAPSAGTILEKLIEVGELVSPQNFGGTRGARTELLSLADLKELQVEIDVNESDFRKIARGQKAKVTLDAYSDRSYDAFIREVAPEANREKATVQVKVAILAPDAYVLPEMSARVDFLPGTVDVGGVE